LILFILFHNFFTIANHFTSKLLPIKSSILPQSNQCFFLAQIALYQELLELSFIKILNLQHPASPRQALNIALLHLIISVLQATLSFILRLNILKPVRLPIGLSILVVSALVRSLDLVILDIATYFFFICGGISHNTFLESGALGGLRLTILKVFVSIEGLSHLYPMVDVLLGF